MISDASRSLESSAISSKSSNKASDEDWWSREQDNNLCSTCIFCLCVVWDSAIYKRVKFTHKITHFRRMSRMSCASGVRLGRLRILYLCKLSIATQRRASEWFRTWSEEHQKLARYLSSEIPGAEWSLFQQQWQVDCTGQRSMWTLDKCRPQEDMAENTNLIQSQKLIWFYPKRFFLKWDSSRGPEWKLAMSWQILSQNQSHETVITYIDVTAGSRSSKATMEYE